MKGLNVRDIEVLLHSRTAESRLEDELRGEADFSVLGQAGDEPLVRCKPEVKNSESYIHEVVDAPDEKPLEP